MSATVPSSGLLPFVQSILNTTVALTTANLASPNTTPSANKATVPNNNGATSLSITATGYGAQQGNCGNPSADWSAVIPQQMCNVYNTILTQANLTYRI
jgi:hypothetical protein